MDGNNNELKFDSVGLTLKQSRNAGVSGTGQSEGSSKCTQKIRMDCTHVEILSLVSAMLQICVVMVSGPWRYSGRGLYNPSHYLHLTLFVVKGDV